MPADSLLGRIWDLEVDGELVPNVEGMCRAILNKAASRLRAPLSDADYDDDLAHLLGEAWRLAPRYDRSKGSKPGPWLHMRLGGALIDRWRSYHGRQGEKRVADIRISDIDGDDDGGWLLDPPDPHDDPADRGLGSASRQVSEDGPESRLDAYLGFLQGRDRGVLRAFPGVGDDPDARVGAGHPGAGSEADMRMMEVAG